MSLLAGLVAFAVAFVATRAFARRAGGTWRDLPSEGERARKPQARAVPTVGGAAVALALAAAWGVARLLGAGDALALDPRLPTWGALASLLAAAAVGAWDDARVGGLAPLAKLAAQAAAVAPVALACAAAHGGAAGVGLALAGVVAMNLVNTWDHQDGAVGSLAAAGFLAAGAWAWCGALLGFLPRNLDAREEEGEGATPTAYLGDAGSHLVGLACVLVPGAAWLLLVPALDLARLVVVRRREGSRPWIGDRRHLSHRLARRPLGRPWVALVTTLVATPGLVGGALGGPAAWFGIAGTAAVFGWAVAAGRP